MPLVNPTLGNPYASVNDVMNTARARVGDMMNDADGDILSNDAPYAQTYLSDAWEWYQEQCAACGVETLKKEITLFGLPMRSTDDVTAQSWITWTGCSDGVYQYEQPVLPQDLIQPVSTWRRQSGTTNTLRLMTLAEDGLPRHLDCNVVDWRDDGAYFYGERYAQDILIRYDAYRIDLDITKPDSLVPMMRCRNVLGARVAFEFANARGDLAGQATKMAALADKFFNDGPAQRTSRRKQHGTFRRQPYGGRRSGAAWPGSGVETWQ